MAAILQENMQPSHFMHGKESQEMIGLSSTSTATATNGDLSMSSVSSLRAAALSTLKSKKKKELETQPPARLMAVRPPVQLDYGSEETTPTSIKESTPIKETTPTPSVSTPPSENSAEPIQTPSSDVEEGEVREEGEISDDEDVAHPVQPPPASTQHSRARSRTSRSKSPKASTSRSVITQDRPQPAAPPHRSVPNGTTTPPQATSSKPDRPLQQPVVQNHFLLDENHVRPGLAMTLSQYNLAKELILDLLGWGVHPEYLVDCGLSRQAVYYVFSELNLKRPSNLDITDIPPYVPPSPFQPSASATILSDTTPSPVKSAINMLPPTSAKRLSLSHPLPPKPGVSLGGSGIPSPTTPCMSSPSLKPAQSTPTLHDMEAQRRQELLARKAVLASRKHRGSTATNTSIAPAETTDMNVDVPSTLSSYSAAAETPLMTSVATEAVDEFLNSIGASVPTVSAPISRERSKSRETILSGGVALSVGRKRSTSSLKSEPDGMEVDGPRPIPGPEVHQSVENKVVQASALFADVLTETPPSSAGFTSFRDIDIPSTVHTLSTTTTTTTSTMTNGTMSRKGTKRPVAADFVDYEPSSAQYGRPSSHLNGHTSYSQPPYMRRKLVHHSSVPFANLVTTRRCVIDLSDSEDDGDMDNEAEEPGGVDGRDPGGGMYQPVPSRTFSTINGTMHRLGTPPASLSVPSTPVSGLSPAALLEKEQQIKRMKELIAQREMNRMKKMSTMGSGTPTTNGASPLHISTEVNVTTFISTTIVEEKNDEASAVDQLQPSAFDKEDVTLMKDDFESPSQFSEADTDKVDEDTIMEDLMASESRTSTSLAGSPCPTPIDTLEHATTKGAVITAEAEQEQVIAPETTRTVTVATSLSTEFMQDQDRSGDEQEQDEDEDENEQAEEDARPLGEIRSSTTESEAAHIGLNAGVNAEAVDDSLLQLASSAEVGVQEDIMSQDQEGTADQQQDQEQQSDCGRSEYYYYKSYDSMFDSYPLLRASSSLSSSALWVIDNNDVHVVRPGSPSPSTGSGSDADADGVPDDDDGMHFEYSTSTSSVSSLPAGFDTSSSSSASFPYSTAFVPSSSTSTSTNQDQVVRTLSAISSDLPKILRQLKVVAALRTSMEDRMRLLCQYEVPGGGECRDARCTNMHLKEMVPSDTDTARHLRQVLPDLPYSESEIVGALQQQSTKKQDDGNNNSKQQPYGLSWSSSFDEHVAEAVKALMSGPGRPLA